VGYGCKDKWAGNSWDDTVVAATSGGCGDKEVEQCDISNSVCYAGGGKCCSVNVNPKQHGAQLCPATDCVTGGGWSGNPAQLLDATFYTCAGLKLDYVSYCLKFPSIGYTQCEPVTSMDQSANTVKMAVQGGCLKIDKDITNGMEFVPILHAHFQGSDHQVDLDFAAQYEANDGVCK
jgi:hypothetical protein